MAMEVLAAITEGSDAFIAFTVMVLAIAVTMFLTVSR
jgi:hypothetical protein